jgi:sigma-B regulation protein RsbQ
MTGCFLPGASSRWRAYGGRVDVLARNNVVTGGAPAGRPLLFVHGFGCDQHMWRYVAPAFADSYRLVQLDLVGAGGSDLSAYDPERYATLDGYASDLVEVIDALDLRDVTIVGHSVSAIIGILAALRRAERVTALVLVAPSPRYIDDGDYVGGFSESDIVGLLESLDNNYLGWSQTMAPVIVGNPDRPELGAEMTASFCRTDPEIQRRFARATFLSDYRDVLPLVAVPTLVLQCLDDPIAPAAVGEFVHAQIAGSRLALLRATGHCPNLSAPAETIESIAEFLDAAPG